MAQITERNGKYYIKVFSRRDINGKRKTINTTFIPTEKTPKKIEKEVRSFAMEFEKAVKEGKILSGEKISFVDMVEEWKDSIVFQNLTISVQESYVDILNRRIIPHIGSMKLAKIEPLHIQKIYNDMTKEGKAPKTVKRTHTALNSVMRYAYDMNSIRENPCNRVKLPKNNVDTELHYFTVEQAQTFLNCLSTEFKIDHPEIMRKNGRIIPAYTETVQTQYQFIPFFYLAIYGGFRRGELIALTWNDIDFENQKISINKAIAKTKEKQIVKETKTKAGKREIALPKECFSVLKEWKSKQTELSFSLGSDWQGYKGKEFDKNNIFIQIENGLRMDIDTPSHKFKKIIKLYNSTCQNEEDQLPDIHLHDLRHTSATLLLANHADIKTVSHRLGHSETSVTLDVYSHWMEETDRTASNILEKLLSNTKQA